MGVRVDASGRVMLDYHTAMDVTKTDGGKPGTVTSYRHYLSDARFLVGLESDDLGLLSDIESALRSPVWFLFLGRKSFVPCVPPHLPEGSIIANKSLEQVLREYPFKRIREREKMPNEPLRVLIEPIEQNGADMTRSDVPLGFDKRRFGLRQVRTCWVEAEELKDGGVWLCTSQN